MRKFVFWAGAAICAVYLLAAVLFGVWSLGTWVGLAAGGVLIAGARLWPRLRAVCGTRGRLWIPPALLAALGAAVLYALVLFGCMAAGAANAPPQAEGTVVVLGSKVNGTVPSADLQARINRAAAYLLEHPELSVVASGGQGAGEEISEAEAIRDGLVALGVDSARIYLEDASFDTEENIAFSKAVMEENGLPEPMLIVTDEYHEFRANTLASRAGITSYAVPGQTPFYLLPACAARELLALTKLFVLG